MTRAPIRLSAAMATLACLAIPPQAPAAESYDACTGFITSLPSTISTQGVWCMRSDLSTAATSGAAITIATNNVTVDCNHFKLGGLAAGNASQTRGIHASNLQNIAVRNCNVRGFRIGVALPGSGGGHLVEDNRFDNSLYIGIHVEGGRNLVRRNSVFETGGVPSLPNAYAILAAADVLENQIDGVYPTTASGNATGILLTSGTASARDNRIRNIIAGSSGNSYGIQGSGGWTTATGNHIVAGSVGGAGGAGIFSVRNCMHNTVAAYSTSLSCTYTLDNLPP